MFSADQVDFRFKCVWSNIIRFFSIDSLTLQVYMRTAKNFAVTIFEQTESCMDKILSLQRFSPKNLTQFLYTLVNALAFIVPLLKSFPKISTFIKRSMPLENCLRFRNPLHPYFSSGYEYLVVLNIALINTSISFVQMC